MRTIIAYSGTHGTGKTTAVYDRISDLKKENPGLLIGPHVENLTFCPYPINRESTEESQLWVFTNHIQAELFLMAHYDIVVSDRTAVDAIAYTSVLGFQPLANHMMQIVQDHMPRYSEINLSLTQGKCHLHDDHLRDTDPKFRADVEIALLWAYQQLGYDFDDVSPGMCRAVRGCS